MLCASGLVDDVMFYVMERMGQNQRQRICFVQFTSWRQRGEVCRLRLYLVFSK